MSDRIDPSNWPSQRGPWPEATDLGRLYDHGRPWCTNANAHPDVNDGYPDPDRHLPWDECHGRQIFLNGVRRDLDGDDIGVGVYAAAAFRFGQPRDGASRPETRIVIEPWGSEPDESPGRVCLSPGEALRLARILVRVVDDCTFVQHVA